VLALGSVGGVWRGFEGGRYLDKVEDVEENGKGGGD